MSHNFFVKKNSPASEKSTNKEKKSLLTKGDIDSHHYIEAMNSHAFLNLHLDHYKFLAKDNEFGFENSDFNAVSSFTSKFRSRVTSSKTMQRDCNRNANRL